MHTVFCDGKDTAEDMVKAAIDMGLRHMGFSGHMDPENGVSMDIDLYCAEIRRLQEKYRGRIDILLGGEMDCLFPDTFRGNDLEYVIGSTHSALYKGHIIPVDDTKEKLNDGCNEFFGGDYYRLSKAYYETEAKIIERVHPDIIGHFDLILRFNDSLHFLDEEDDRYLKSALETLEFLAGTGIPFEINCGAVNRGRKAEFYPDTTLLKALHDMGGRIILNSDAHSADKITGAFDLAAKKAIECGFTHACILRHNEAGEVVIEEEPLG